jgi:predicted phosphodiesterase
MDADKYIRAHIESSDAEIAKALGITPGAVRSRRRRIGLNKTSDGAVREDGQWRVVADKLIEALKKNNVEPELIGMVKSIRVSTWTTTIKNADGEAEAHDNQGVQLVLDPAFSDGPKWPVIQQAPQVPIKLPKPKVNKAKVKTAIILPDPQIGFRRDLVEDTLDPFHDEKAMSIALQIIADVAPDQIINLGDFLDFPSFSRFIQEPTFALTTQKAINRGYRFLVEQRASAPNAKVTLIAGNHDIRINKSIITNASAAFGLHRAEKPDNWPVLSVPFLLRLDELNVEYIDGYPAGEYWINDNLKCIHGVKVRSNGSTAMAVVADDRVSTIFGHVHRMELQYKTVNVKDGFKTRLAFTPGTLARIDGTVPSTNGGTDEWGKPVTRYENWQQGIGIVHYEEGNGDFHVYGVHIHNGKAMYNGKLYTA